MMHEHFHAALVDIDVALARKMWAYVMPNMPQPTSDANALTMIHYARTLMPTLTLRQRAYSNAWLLERALPSGLPDHLRPRAQRMYPVTVGSVGIATRGSSEVGRAIAPLVRSAMEQAVLEAYADGHSKEPAVVKERMMQARKLTIKKLLG